MVKNSNHKNSKKKSDADSSSHKENVRDNDEVKKLYRSKEDRRIAGICGGIAEYFKVDSIWVRIVMILLVFADGIGIVLYIIAWLLVPENPNQKSKSKKKDDFVEEIATNIKKDIDRCKAKKDRSAFFGVILIGLGGFFLLRNYVSWVDFGLFWPVALIAIGFFLMKRYKK